MSDVTEVRALLENFGKNLVEQHPLGQHRCGSKRWMIPCPPQVLGESVLAALVAGEIKKPEPRGYSETFTLQRTNTIRHNLGTTDFDFNIRFVDSDGLHDDLLLVQSNKYLDTLEFEIDKVWVGKQAHIIIMANPK